MSDETPTSSENVIPEQAAEEKAQSPSQTGPQENAPEQGAAAPEPVTAAPEEEASGERREGVTGDTKEQSRSQAGAEAGVQAETDGRTGAGGDGANPEGTDKTNAGDTAGSWENAGKDDAGKDAGGKDAGGREGPDAAAGDRKPNDQSEKSKGDAGAESPAADVSKEQQETFRIYEEALGAADWAHKSKSGHEREIGHKSVGLAERAYLAAALYDKKSADELWEKATHKPPKAELQARLEEARKIDPAQGIADLTAGLGALKERQNLWNLTLNKEKLGQQMANWESVLGDIAERARQHRRKASDQLLQPEHQGRDDDSGLGMFMRAIIGGVKAGRDLKAAKMHKNNENDHLRRIDASRKAHGIVSSEIEDFIAGKGDGIPETKGEVGKTSKRFGGVADMVKDVLDRSKAKSEKEAAGQDRTIDPAMAAKMAKQTQDAGMGV